jgi:hypothetical protein
MSLVRTVARLALGTLVAAEAVGAATRFRERQAQFAAAQARAVATGRRLVVIGAPGNGLHTRIVPAYGCGDVCVDLTGCPACPISETVDITTGRTTVPDNSAVVYVSCVLEYVSDLGAAVREISRMAGSADNVFNVGVQPWTMTAALYPGAQQTVTIGGAIAVVEPVSATRKVATVGLLAGLAWAAW